MSGVTRFYKGIEYVNRVSYDALGNAYPTRSASTQREWCQRISFADGTGLVTEQFSFPPNSFICYDAVPYIYVRVAEVTGTTKTINVGVTGTAAGILSGISVAATGLVFPSVATPTLGSLLYTTFATTPAVNVPTPYVTVAGVALTWTPASANFAQLDADIIIPYHVFDDAYQIPNLNSAMGPSP